MSHQSFPSKRPRKPSRRSHLAIFCPDPYSKHVFGPNNLIGSKAVTARAFCMGRDVNRTIAIMRTTIILFICEISAHNAHKIIGNCCTCFDVDFDAGRRVTFDSKVSSGIILMSELSVLPTMDVGGVCLFGFY